MASSRRVNWRGQMTSTSAVVEPSSTPVALGGERRPHVCIVTTAHPVDDVRVKGKLVQAFCDAGFRVSWAGPGHWLFDPSAVNDTRVEWHLCRANRSRADRLMAAWHVWQVARTVTDVDVFYTPDPDGVEIIVRLAKRQPAKTIFDVHEVFHGALLERWMFGRRVSAIREFARLRIRRSCRSVSLVVGVSSHVLESYDVSEPVGMVVRSCAPRLFADHPAADVCGVGRNSLLVMHGKCGLTRGSLCTVESLEVARARGASVQVLMMASGRVAEDPEAIEIADAARRRGLETLLVIRDGVPHARMPEVLQSCDVGLIAYGRSFGVDSLPNRLFEYMAAGLAVVAPEYAREIERIVRTEECGLLVDCEDPERIGEALTYLAEHPEQTREMGRRAREAFLARHNWTSEVEPLLETIRGWCH